MRSNIHEFLLVVTFGILVAQASPANEPGGVPWCPQFQAIQDAARIPDPAKREAALREAIRKGLLEKDPALANEVLGYLGRNSRWLDFRPFEDIINEYGRINPYSRNTGWFLDEAELVRMPRDERLRTYSAAIVDGKAALKRGTPMIRLTAIASAAIDGLAELKPLIEAHYAELSAEDQQAFPLKELLLWADLGTGAIDREDAARLASERLAAMKDDEFRDRMNTDPAFQTVVDKVSSYVCGVDPYLVRRNPGCASIKAIVGRQLVVDKATRQASEAATKTSTIRSDEEQMDSWLGRMQESSEGEPASQPPR